MVPPTKPLHNLRRPLLHSTTYHSLEARPLLKMRKLCRRYQARSMTHGETSRVSAQTYRTLHRHRQRLQIPGATFQVLQCLLSPSRSLRPLHIPTMKAYGEIRHCRERRTVLRRLRQIHIQEAQRPRCNLRSTRCRISRIFRVYT